MARRLLRTARIGDRLIEAELEAVERGVGDVRQNNVECGRSNVGRSAKPSERSRPTVDSRTLPYRWSSGRSRQSSATDESRTRKTETV
jgi:hypothetical protein